VGTVGDIPTAKNYIKPALAALKEGRPIEKTVTKPYGCAVKYPKMDT
jgi:hypothetical protein